MQPVAGSRPAVVRIAAVGALIVAAVILGAVGVLGVVAARALANPEGGLVFVPVVVVDILGVALALGFVVAARRLLRGDPRILWQVGLGTGTACAVGAVFVIVDGPVRGDTIDVPALVGLVVLAVVCSGLAWLPNAGAGRAWLAAHRPPPT